jgi:hypothetical protein
MDEQRQSEETLSPVQKLYIELYGVDGKGGIKADVTHIKERTDQHHNVYIVGKWLGWLLGPAGVLYVLSQLLPGFLQGGP